MSDESTTSDLVELTRRSYEVATRGDLDVLVRDTHAGLPPVLRGVQIGCRAGAEDTALTVD
jgi:hypothetical protein